MHTHTHRHRTEPKEYQEKKIFSLSPVEMVRVILVYISCHMLPINRVLIDFLAEINTGLSNILWRHPNRSHSILIANDKPFFRYYWTRVFRTLCRGLWGDGQFNYFSSDQNISPWSIHFFIWFNLASSASVFVWFVFRWYIFFSKLSTLSMWRFVWLDFGIARIIILKMKEFTKKESPYKCSEVIFWYLILPALD